MATKLSIADAASLEGFSTLTDVAGRNFQLLGGGSLQFMGVIVEAPQFDPQTELGADPREKCVLESINPPAAIVMNSKIRDLTTGDTYQVVARDNNQSDFATSFTLVHVVTGKDA